MNRLMEDQENLLPEQYMEDSSEDHSTDLSDVFVRLYEHAKDLKFKKEFQKQINEYI